MTPFRQLYRAYSTLLGLREAVEVLTHKVNVNAAALQSIAPKVDNTAQALSAIAPKMDGVAAAIGTINDAIVAKATKQIDVYERLGFTFMLDRNSLVDRVMIETGSWEPGQVEFFTRLLEHFRSSAGNVFLDIGGYWGLYSFLALKTRIFTKHYAFEADAHNFSQLQSNIFLNRAASEITAFNKAVSSKSDTLNVWNSLTHPDGNRGGVGIVDEGFHLPTARVDSIAIDDFIELKGVNIAIKMDVEGHEQHALKGLERTFRENRILMQVEIYPNAQDAVLPLLEKFGLRCIKQIEYDFYYTNIDPSALGY